ncbi:outer membrane protein assembly factor BamA [Aquisalimonas asiatica]|uniref:Outer membrane protein assembly factor BamA n=1 Tax=Aquisalimonas asiatica TaxID=406100 RepID=A0A1H8QJJ4_9GAMM|nr:outer membrane protein assembly factor BamA [Aquisalimonas asiatica]SEO54410.1 Beta-barrel assembly machine subunit BamA [Aquisalimonas asiatica]
MRKLVVALTLCVAVVAPVQAFEAFTVEDIRVEGLRRIAPGTVFNYLPITTNDEVDRQLAADAVRALYDTGFFQDVELERDGNALVVNVVERPSVADIEISGNSAIPTDALKQAMSDSGLAEGETYNRALLEGIERELRRQYFGQGRYDVEIETTVSPLPRNRVAIRIDIDEGQTARIRDVHFVGNDAFSDRELDGVFSLGRKPWYLPFSRRDRYSREALSGDLENLRSHYMNRGYADFSINSSQVSMTPDRSGIYVTINMDEGEEYRLGDVRVIGDTVVEPEELEELIELETGDLFSQERITGGANRIRERLGQEGYAFANVNPVPDINRDEQTVDLTFYVDSGSRAYVRRINISGNYRTDDEVIRREMRQMEGGWLSSENIDLSRRRLNQLGFFQNVEIETPQVPGESDQVDVNVDVTEGLSGSLQAGIGYGSGQGMLLNFSVAQDNVLGTGDRMQLALNNSRVSSLYQLSYTDRYYNVDGVTRYFNASLRETDARRARLSDYGVRAGNLDIGFGIPLNEEDQVRIDVGYEDLRLNLGSQATDDQRDFVDEFGDQYENFKTEVSWIRNTYDRRIFPTSGARQSLGIEASLPQSDLQYYKANYSHRRYFSLAEDWSLSLQGRLGYGEGYGDTSRLPFFENFFTGGINSVRGYRASSLGLRGEDDRPTGGNFRAVANAELYFPVPFIDSPAVRFSTFVDGGQVYNTREQDIDFDDMRYSAGVAFTWMSPLGALTMSLAEPLNDEPGDDLDRFQFSLGQFF